MERVYTISLGIIYKNTRNVRAKRATKYIREFISKHMKTELENVNLSMSVNSYVFWHGMKKPPRKIKVKAIKDEKTNKVMVRLSDEDLETKFTKKTITKKLKEKKKDDKKEKDDKDKEQKDKSKQLDDKKEKIDDKKEKEQKDKSKQLDDKKEKIDDKKEKDDKDKE